MKNECDYCIGDIAVRNYLMADYEETIGVYIDRDNYLVSDELGLIDANINYCPMCGRKLVSE